MDNNDYFLSAGILGSICVYIYKYMYMFYYICLNTPNTSNDFHKGGLQNPYDHKTLFFS